MTQRRVAFGYNPPTGDRGDERVVPGTFVRDLQHVLDFAARHFSSLWVTDHHMMGDRFRLDGWTQLAWMAARYPGPMLGTAVLAQSYRHPPLLAKMVATLQLLSQGRLILGYGAGYWEEEYRAYGFDYPPTPVRVAQLEEAIRVIRTLWTESPATFDGRFYRVANAYCEPRPDPLPQLLIAGEGEKHVLRVVAQHADLWLSRSHPPDVLIRKLEVLRRHCRDVGRDFGAIRLATPLSIYLRRDRAAALAWAGDAVNRGQPAFAGDPAALRDHLAQLVDLGFELFLLSFAGFPDTGDLELFADEVLPAFL